MLFHKERHAETEVYNDINGELVNLFRIVKYHCEELQRELRFYLNSRELFENQKNIYMEGLTDIQRAARFFMQIKTSYGSMGIAFGCVKRDISVMVDYLKAIEERLKNVVIEHKDFERLIIDFEKKNSLFFLDPPYYGSEKYYTAPFTDEDHIRLFNALGNTRNRFILTYNDCEFIRDLYKGCNIHEIIRTNNLSTQNNSKFRELIITNY